MAAVVGWLAGKLLDTVGGWIAEKFWGTTIDKLTKREDGLASSQMAADLERAVEGLKNRLDGIKAVLHDAGEREIQEESVKDWLKKIKLLAYDAEDVLEDYEYEMLLYQMKEKATPESQASFSSSSSRKRKREEAEFCSPTVAKGLVDRINNINERFDVITKNREALCLKVGDKLRWYDYSESQQPTGSHVIESDIYGREDDKGKIVKLLLSGHEKFTVLPIVGMGGVGKTTLAQLVYNDESISKSFNLKGWIYVSNDFDVLRLTRAILESLTKESPNFAELYPLQDFIKRILKGKTVFLVLDDIWNEDQSRWDTLKATLVGAKVIKIIITTRNDSVARIMQTREPYHIGCLTEEESWRLFKRHAFIDRDPNKHTKLVEIGQKIVKKCDGLPLAVKVVSGLLRHKKADEETWEEILQSNLWELGETQTKILPALKLSYRHMPYYLKPCFLYSSLFPKDYEINKDMLVRLWVAQGYITQPTKIKSAEDVGREYVEELQRRSLLQSVDDRQIRMHDLVHDLSLYISGNECYQVTVESDIETYDIPGEVRHLHITMRQQRSFPHRLISCLPKALRTVVLDGFEIVTLNGQFGFPFENLGCLRALVLRCSTAEELPDSICNLKHLRHLIVEARPMGHRSLLSRCDWRFHRSVNNSSIRMPRGIGKLIRLGTLNCNLAVGRNAQHCGIEELKGLVNLGGDLCITGLRNVARVEDAMKANLQSKQQIKKMVFDWWDEEQCRDAELEAAVLDNLRPCTNLKQLEIMGYGGTRFSSWMADPCFSRLVSVKLMSINNCERLPALGQLLSLQKLIICSMPRLRSVGPEFCRVTLPAENTPCMASFPSLESLSFAGMPEWEEWCGVLDGDFPRICDLVIKECPKVRTLSLLRSTLQVLEIVDAPQLSSEVVGLHNFSSLKQLKLQDCPQLWFPPDEPLPPTLQVLTLVGCGMLNMVPLHGTQSALDSLIIADCALLELVSGLHSLSSLRTLRLRDCPQLRLSPDSSEPLPPTLEFLEVTGEGWEEAVLDSFRACTNLRSLIIERYHGARFPSWMGDPSFSRLVNVELSVVENCERLPALGQLPSLKFLRIEGMRRLRKMGREFCCSLTCENTTTEGSFPSLEWLYFEDMPEWEEWCGVGDADFPRLSRFQINKCPKMRSLPLLQTLSVLEHLAIGHCDLLESVSGLQSLSSLRNLILIGCPQLRLSTDEPLPRMLWELTVQRCGGLSILPLPHTPTELRRLSINECPQLSSLAVGLQALASLRSLFLKSCPKLQIPPSERLSSIPDEVIIEDCPELMEWCQAQGFTYTVGIMSSESDDDSSQML